MKKHWLAVIVFVVGSASLGSEIAAARMLAPWFGASTIVWANTIATVLVALSIGYAVGGRVADKRPHLAGLSVIVLASALLLAVVPFVSSPFLRASTKAFEDRSGGIFLGSLLGVGVLIAVPVLLLGMVSPYAVRLAVHDVTDAGRTAGRLYAIGTVGSLTGTFAASLLLIPLAGTRRTFLIFALALALVALPGISRLRAVAAVAAAGILGLMFVPVGVTKPVTSDGKVIWEEDTEYQYARVIEDEDGTRILELNEGQAVHSEYTPGQYVTDNYWGAMIALTHAGEQPPKRVLNLGSAAGTIARSLTHFWDDIEVDAVELDPEVTAVGKELFDLPSERVHTYDGDARPWLQGTEEKYDAILLDAYRQPYIPFYLTTREFFTEVREHLNPGGVMLVNIGHPEGNDELEKVLSATARDVFGDARVHRDPVEELSTILLATTTDHDAKARLEQAAQGLDAQVADELTASAARLEPALRGGKVYTDDRAPVEWLIDVSLAAEAN